MESEINDENNSEIDKSKCPVEVAGFLGMSELELNSSDPNFLEELKNYNAWFGFGRNPYIYTESMLVHFAKWASNRFKTVLIVIPDRLETHNLAQPGKGSDIVKWIAEFELITDRANKRTDTVERIIKSQPDCRNVKVKEWNEVLRRLSQTNPDKKDAIAQLLEKRRLNRGFQNALNKVVEKNRQWKEAAFPEIKKYRERITRRQMSRKTGYAFDEIKMSIALAEAEFEEGPYEIKIGHRGELIYDIETLHLYGAKISSCDPDIDMTTKILEPRLKGRFGAIYLDLLKRNGKYHLHVERKNNLHAEGGN